MNKTVLITGASDGIGRATALFFAENGYNIVAVGRRNREYMASLTEALDKIGVASKSFLLDVGNFDEVSNMFQSLEKNNLLPDIIINNAGVSYVGLLQDMSPCEWNKIIETNLTGMFNTSKLAIPHMISKKSGKIINISSMWGNVGASCEVAYSASKGGVNSFTKALAKELAPSNIQVNAIAFGCVDTKMNSFLSEEDRQMLISEIPAGRMCSPSEAASIIYKVTMLDEYVTGQVITADGGYT